MQPFFAPESLSERDSRLSCVAELGRAAEEAAAIPRPHTWRVLVGRALMSAGSRLAPAGEVPYPGVRAKLQ